jgi:hypothetical protein
VALFKSCFVGMHALYDDTWLWLTALCVAERISKIELLCVWLIEVSVVAERCVVAATSLMYGMRGAVAAGG